MGLIPARLGSFEIVALLGVGGMAETFIARRLGTTEEVCLKVVRRDLLSNRKIRALFMEEVKIHQRLSHPNIVRVLEAGASAGRAYLALELVRGASLAQLLNCAEDAGRTLPVHVATHIVREVCAALGHAHDLTVGSVPLHLVHRDISPSNVLISESGAVKLSDFGIAKARTRSFATTAGMVRGKVAYFSPEQSRGQAVDRRSDLFSLGVVAHELFTGHHPFADENTNDAVLLQRLLGNQRERVSSLAPHLPRALADLTECLLAPEAERRPDSASLVGRLLEPHVTKDSSKDLGAWVAMARAQAFAPLHERAADLERSGSGQRPRRAHVSEEPVPLAVGHVISLSRPATTHAVPLRSTVPQSAHAAACRAGWTQHFLTGIRELSDARATRALSAIDKAGLRALESSLSVGWLPFEIHMNVLTAARSVLGPQGFRRFCRERVRTSLDNLALFAKPARALQFVGASPWVIVKAIPVSVNYIFRSAGDVRVNVASDQRSVTVIHEHFPARFAQGDEWNLIWLGTVEACANYVFEVQSGTPVVETVMHDPARGYFEWRVTRT